MSIKIKVDKDYKGESKSWGMSAKLDAVDIRSGEEAISNLTEGCRSPWIQFLFKLEELGVTELVVAESDTTIFPDVLYAEDLPVSYKLVKDSEGFTIHSEVNCNYLEAMDYETNGEKNV